MQYQGFGSTPQPLALCFRDRAIQCSVVHGTTQRQVSLLNHLYSANLTLICVQQDSGYNREPVKSSKSFCHGMDINSSYFYHDKIELESKFSKTTHDGGNGKA